MLVLLLPGMLFAFLISVTKTPERTNLAKEEEAHCGQQFWEDVSLSWWGRQWSSWWPGLLPQWPTRNGTTDHARETSWLAPARCTLCPEFLSLLKQSWSTCRTLRVQTKHLVLLSLHLLCVFFKFYYLYVCIWVSMCVYICVYMYVCVCACRGGSHMPWHTCGGQRMTYRVTAPLPPSCGFQGSTSGHPPGLRPWSLPSALVYPWLKLSYITLVSFI